MKSEQSLRDGGGAPGWVDGETRLLESPEDHDGDARLWVRLLTCSTLIETEIRRRLKKEFDSTLPRFELLAQLERAEDGMALSEVARRMMVSAGNITVLVERLSESGHITRTASVADKRVHTIMLTSYGRAEFEKMAASHSEWVAEMFSQLKPKDAAALMDSLSRLKGSIVSSLES